MGLDGLEGGGVGVQRGAAYNGLTAGVFLQHFDGLQFRQNRIAKAPGSSTCGVSEVVRAHSTAEGQGKG